jgi:hypothetical protein
MPGINGLALQRHLARTGVPVILIIGGGNPAVRETALGVRRCGLSAKAIQRRNIDHDSRNGAKRYV